MEFIDIKIENIAETDGASTSSEVKLYGGHFNGYI